MMHALGTGWGDALGTFRYLLSRVPNDKTDLYIARSSGWYENYENSGRMAAMVYQQTFHTLHIFQSTREIMPF